MRPARVEELIAAYHRLDASPDWRALPSAHGADCAWHPAPADRQPGRFARIVRPMGHPPEVVFRRIAIDLESTYTEFNPQALGVDVLEQRSARDRAIVLRYAMPWPLTNRACAYRQIWLERGDAWYEVALDRPDLCPPGFVHLPLRFSVRVVTPTPSGARVSAIFRSDLGGWMRWLMPAATHARLTARDTARELAEVERRLDVPDLNDDTVPPSRGR